MSPRVVVITGGYGGIATATARQLAAAGLQAVLAVRAVRRERSAAFTGIAGIPPLVLSCDVTRPGAVERFFARVESRCGPVEALINNAATMRPIGPIGMVDPRAWLGCIEAGLGGAYLCSQRVLPGFRDRDHGTIINLASGAAYHALPGWSAYCCAKAGLSMLTACLTAETTNTGIRIYGLDPGMVRTDMVRDALREKVNRVAALDPETFSDPDEPARVIRWLCEQRPADLSGREVLVTDSAIRGRAGLPGTG